jgi:hypothetical protein
LEVGRADDEDFAHVIANSNFGRNRTTVWPEP